jgi:hypothetical protein
MMVVVMSAAMMSVPRSGHAHSDRAYSYQSCDDYLFMLHFNLPFFAFWRSYYGRLI